MYLAAAALVSIVLLLIIVTAPIGRVDRSASPSNQPAGFYRLDAGSAAPQPELQGRAAPGLSASTAAPALETLDGRPFSWVAYQGRPVWVVFWATWCTPCQQEAPDIQATYRRLQADGLAILAIDIGESADEVRAYLRAHGLSYPAALDRASAAASSYGVYGIPSHFFVNRDGTIREVVFGRLTLEQMAAKAAAIVAGR